MHPKPPLSPRSQCSPQQLRTCCTPCPCRLVDGVPPVRTASGRVRPTSHSPSWEPDRGRERSLPIARSRTRSPAGRSPRRPHRCSPERVRSASAPFSTPPTTPRRFSPQFGQARTATGLSVTVSPAERMLAGPRTVKNPNSSHRVPYRTTNARSTLASGVSVLGLSVRSFPADRFFTRSPARPSRVDGDRSNGRITVDDSSDTKIRYDRTPNRYSP